MSRLVSIVIPVYNVAGYVANCLNSCISQTYDNLQIIVVNDGSTDDSYKICQEIAQKDKRIQLLNKENGGISDARNYGIDHANGDYIMFVDSDDYIHKSMVETLLNLAEATSSDIAMCGFKRTYILDEMDIPVSCDNYMTYYGVDALYHLFNGAASLEFVVVWNKLYKRMLFDDLRFPKGRINEDEYVTYKLFKDGVKTVRIEQPLYYYVQREGSITHSSFSEKTYDKVIAAKEKAEWLSETRFCSDAYKFYFIIYISFLQRAKKAKLTNYQSYLMDYKSEYHKNKAKLTIKHRLIVFVRYYMPLLYKVLH